MCYKRLRMLRWTVFPLQTFKKENFLIFCAFLINILCHSSAENSIKEIELDFQVAKEFGGFSTVKDHDSMVVCYMNVHGARLKGRAKFDASDSDYNFDGNLCTHLVLNFFKLSRTFEIEEDDDFDEILKFRTIKEKYPHLLVLLEVVLEEDNNNALLKGLTSSTESRQKFIMHLKTSLRELLLDGVLMDNSIYGSAPNRFNTLLQELKEEFKKENLLIAVEMNLAVKEWFHEYPSIAEISRICDIVIVSTYNFNYNNNNARALARHKAPLYSTERDDENIYDNLRTLFSQWQISRKNLVLQILERGLVLNLENDTRRSPFGYNNGADSWGIQGPWRGLNRWGYDEICSTVLNEKDNWTMYWDDTAKFPFLKNEKRWITFENPRSVAEKTKLVSYLGLRGIALKPVNNDDVLGLCSDVAYPLLKTVNNQLSSSKSERESQLCSLYYVDDNNDDRSVNYKPVLTLSSSVLKVPKGETVEINCTVEGSPPFDLSWKKADRHVNILLKNNNNVNIINTDLKSVCTIKTLVSTLKIKEINSSDNYFCELSYANGTASKSVPFKIQMVKATRRTPNWNNDPLKPVVDVTSSSTITIWITSILFPLLLFAIAVIAFLIIVLQRKKKYLQGVALTKQEIVEFLKGKDGCCEDTLDPDNEPYDDSYELLNSEYEIDKTKILGSGAFGVVFGGQVKDAHAAVKTTKPGADKQYLKSLLSELKILAYIDHHPNVVNLVGAVTTELTKGVLYVFVEFCPLGNLLDYLRKSREQFTIDIEGVNEEAITLTHLFKWSLQISKGLCHLSSKNLIHGDLAARNVLLYDKDTIKITDFGLSRKLYEYTTYAKKNQEPLPWRWMAIESLRDMTFSIKSDVWSFGITIWEIFALGETPYPGLIWSCDFVDRLEQNMRLQKPKYASDLLHSTLMECWKTDPNDRPSPQKNLESLSILMREHINNNGYLKNEEMDPEVKMDGNSEH